MEIVVRGRNVEVPDHYRHHVADKLRRVERFDHKLISIDVELYHEKNPRQANSCQRVEITCASRGPIVRSEACAPDFYTALDTAVSKLQTRLRRSADRRRVHHGTRTPTSVAAATTAATNGTPASPSTVGTAVLDRTEVQERPDRSAVEGGQDQFAASTPPEDAPQRGLEGDDHSPGRVVREKEHPAKPMSIDQALFEMELVGHDFYLFSDADSGRPSVVYRRKGYDYGVIRLTD